MPKKKKNLDRRNARIRELRSAARRRQRSSRAANRSVRKFRIHIDLNGERKAGWAERRRSMPQVFCLDDNYEETAAAIAEVRSSMTFAIEQHFKFGKGRRNSQRMHSFFDLASIKRCSPGAALVLASEYDRAKQLVKGPIPVVNIKEWSPAVRHLLQDLGFFDLLGIVVPQIETRSDGPIRMVQFRSGELVGNEEAGELIRTLGEIVLSVDPDALRDPVRIIRRLRLFEALVEATENATHHAYPLTPTVAETTVRRWWMTGAIDSLNKRLTIAVYDQGISIPGSLPQWAGHGWIENGLRRLIGHIPAVEDPIYDPHRLRLAMAKPRSSTGQDERGKGLPLLRGVIDHCSHGRIRILSRGGEFVQEKGGRGRAQRLETPMTGTLIEWDLWL